MRHFIEGDKLLTEREEKVIYEGTTYDTEEEDKVANFLQSECGCILYFGGSCNRAFTGEHLKELDRSSFNHVLLGILTIDHIMGLQHTS